ncbi:MAG TPA: DNA internalization-related competence protein ComEC/Rec2 [Pseudomonadota bacterium]|nr:DNA internalization-related competence protein ComEC/Rec2 [Xanthomonadales bacterium]HQW80573.1 DNA internalization-related competence protein ComEC/Rec2 [Pseudomonadota bacterium]
MLNLPRFAPGFLIGAVVACAVPTLPPLAWVITIGVVALATLWLRIRWLIPVAAVLVGGTWLWFNADGALQSRLPAAADGRDLPMQIEVVGLPELRERQIRFEARVVQSELLDRGAKLRLNWYTPAPELRAGDRIEATLRLRRPRGLMNPGGFDFERHALTERIAAVGYVRTGQVTLPGAGGALDRLRGRIAERIDARVANPTIAALLRALAIGDVRGLRDDDWDVLRATGTGHLIAISGLHVGLVAAVGAWWFALLYRLFPRLGLRWPRPQAMAVGALFTATAYALLAGFGVPVVRTLLMIAVALSATLMRRRFRSGDALLIAALVIVVIDPLSLLGAGFWLSFVGVAFLIWAMTGSEASLGGLWRAQVAMSVGLLPIGAWWFAQTSVIGFAANLIAVPWITFVVVPMLLLAMLFDAITGWNGLYAVPAALLEPLWSSLAAAAASPWAQWQFAQFGLWALMLAVVGAAWALLPRGVPMRAAGLLLMLPLLWPRHEDLSEGEFELTVFDVGQGLSTLVRTRTHAMLYDTGARVSADFDFGDAVVVPSLYALAVGQLDRLMISHLDDDHAGGRGAVKRAFPEALESIGNEADPAPRCEAGQHWTWDGVRFDVLHPPQHFPDLDNDNSCVLRIASPRGSALLPGDIGTLIEQRLVREQAAAIDVDVVVAAHHGSKNSSSPAFVAATSADTVVFSRGWRSRFGHPAAEVVQRWMTAGAVTSDTAVQGAITIRFDRNGAIVHSARDDSAVFWREHGHDAVLSGSR